MNKYSAEKMLAQGKDSPVIEQKVKQNAQVRGVKQEVEDALVQYEAAKGTKAADDWQKQLELKKWKADEVEAEVRAKARQYVIAQFAAQAETLESQASLLDLQIAWLRHPPSTAKDTAPTRATPPAPQGVAESDDPFLAGQTRGHKLEAEHAAARRSALAVELENTKGELASLNQKLGTNHPTVIAMKDRVSRIERQIKQLELLLNGLAHILSPPVKVAATQPTESVPPAAGVDYVIRPNDLLSVTIADLAGPGKDMVRTVRVSGTGNILLPYLGKVKAAGQSEIDLSTSICKAYKDSRVAANADVSVTVLDAGPGSLKISGEVTLPASNGPALPILTDVQDPAARAIDTAAFAKLHKPQVIDCNPLPAKDAILAIAINAGVDVLFDDRELGDGDANLQSPVTLRIKQPTPGDQLVRWVLRDIPRLSFTIDHGVLLIADGGKIDRMTTTRVYDLNPLIEAPDSDSLLQIIREVIAPDSWRENGGPGVVRLLGLKLLVTQTAANHAEVEKLLALLAAKGKIPHLPSSRVALPPSAHSAAFESSANHVRQILLGIQMYAGDHDGKLPKSLREDLKPYLDGQDEALFTNPRAPGKKDGYVYLRPADRIADLKDPAKTLLLYEAVEDFNEGIVVGYAEGHVEYTNVDELKAKLGARP